MSKWRFVNGIVCMLRFYLIGKGKWKKEDSDKNIYMHVKENYFSMGFQESVTLRARGPVNG